MKAIWITGVAALAVAVIGIVSLPKSADATVRLYGQFEDSTGKTGDLPLVVSFHDIQTGDVVHRASAVAHVLNGSYFAEMDAGVLDENGLYAMSLATQDSEASGGDAGIQFAFVPVQLQPVTPGAAQVGHANISGTLIAGFFSGDGSLLTNVDAETLDGLDSTDFLPSTVPVVVNGSVAADGVIQARNTNSANQSSGVAGHCDAELGWGVFGDSFGTDCNGVFGFARATSGVTRGSLGVALSPSGYGAFGLAGATTGTATGIAGQTQSSTGWAVFGFGDIGATGTKSFRIDHPFDPTNKYLLHYCSEGPEPLNIYTGTVRTDSDGYAIVALPDYFETINRDYRYSLTVIDGSEEFVLAKVVSEVEGNAFVIRTSSPRVKVSWEVKGVRNDRWVRAYGAPVVLDKTGSDLGTYQHPELFGMGEELGINYGTLRHARTARD